MVRFGQVRGRRLVLLVLSSVLVAAPLPAAVTEVVSAALWPATGPGGGSVLPSLSGDGRFVAFASQASNLVAGDTNGSEDVFVHDRLTGATVRVSIASGGAQGNDSSSEPAISADGRWVAFYSRASNLAPGDANDIHDLFAHDRQTGATLLVSQSLGGGVGNGGSYAPALSADGRHVAFDSLASDLVAGDTNGGYDVFVRDLVAGTTTRVSLGAGGAEGDNWSLNPAISADGRYVAFESRAANLAGGDTNGVSDVFVRDLVAGTTSRVSLGAGGSQATGASSYPSISADGRWVAFVSAASDLVAGDTNGVDDIFVHDRQTGSTERVSVTGSGSEAGARSQQPKISADGRFVVFLSTAGDLVSGDTNGADDVFVHDRQTGETARVSIGALGEQGDSYSGAPALSSDGRLVAFYSMATNLVAGDSNGGADVFVRDRQLALTERVPEVGIPAPAGAPPFGNGRSTAGGLHAVNGDGRYVVFESTATNLVAGDTNGVEDSFVRDRWTGTTTRVSVASGGGQGNAASFASAISSDGRYVAFSSLASNMVTGDTNGVTDVFVRDLQTGITSRVSVDSAGAEGDLQSYAGVLSGDGRYVAFHSLASNLVAGDSDGYTDVFVHDRQTGLTERVSESTAGVAGNSGSFAPSISTDGRLVVFTSAASNLVPGDTNGTYDVFLRDRQAGTTIRVSVDAGGAGANQSSTAAVISADGGTVAFASYATNLVPGVGNGHEQIFVRDLASGEVRVVSVDSAGTLGDSSSRDPSISADGQRVAFYSLAANLVAGDLFDTYDVFVHDLPSGATDRVSVDSAGGAANAWSAYPAISGDGRVVAFESEGNNLVWGDTNGTSDVFVRDFDATAGICVPTATTACLQNGRFEVRVAYQTGSGSGEGRVMSFGGARTENTDSVFYWFFTPTNYEMGLKVLDACVPALGNRYWVFVSGLTDQGWTVTVRDTATGLVRAYTNEVGTLSETFADTETFGCATSGEGADLAPVPEASRQREVARWREELAVRVEQGGLPAATGKSPCVRSATTACLQGGRFEVEVSYETSSGSGEAEVMSFAGQRTENVDSVFYTFFTPTNFEMGLKVLDACVPALGNRFWVFGSGLTDQGWTVRVRDTVSDRGATYSNPVGILSQTFLDAASFPCE